MGAAAAASGSEDGEQGAILEGLERQPPKSPTGFGQVRTTGCSGTHGVSPGQGAVVHGTSPSFSAPLRQIEHYSTVCLHAPSDVAPDQSNTSAEPLGRAAMLANVS